VDEEEEEEIFLNIKFQTVCEVPL